MTSEPCDGNEAIPLDDHGVLGPKSSKRRDWSTTKVVAMTVLTVVGTLASVIGVVQVITRDTTDISHLTISAEKAAGARTDWAVPVARIGEIPNAGACDEELHNWLEVNAQRLERRFLLTLANSASEGSMLALTNLRSVATVSPERGELAVLVICDPAGVVDDRVYYGRVDADQPETSARHVQLHYGRPPNSPSEIPITYNLAPGESGQFLIEVFSKYPASGSLSVSVLHREEHREVEIDGTEFHLPSLLAAGDIYLVTGKEGIACRKVHADSLVDCTLGELEAEVAAAPR